MTARQLNPATLAAVDANAVYPAWLFRLDIEGDPVIVWTGARDISFGAMSDPALSNLTFERVGNVGDIGNIVDGRGGSQAVQLKLPGVDLDDDALRQVVRDRRRWQFRQAWIWIATLDANYDLVGEPFRVKTGRMDRMKVGKGRRGSYVQLTIESHQAYAAQVGNQKYSELADFDPTDTSQNFVHDLANRVAIIGGAVANNPAVNAAVSVMTGGRINMSRYQSNQL